jgi:Mg-chelatase subunit ChlD
MHDADGSTSSAALTITINGTDDHAHVTVDASGTDVTVYEHGLTSVADTTETSGNHFTVEASDGISTVKVGSQTFTIDQLQTIHTSGTPSAGFTVGDGTMVITDYTISATGIGNVSYTYTLNHAITHPLPGADTLTENVAVTVTGITGTTDTANLKINIVDDVPHAGDQTVTVGAGHSAGTNLLLVIDTTGSMGDNPGVTGYSTKLALEKAALDQLITEYGTHGDVMVRLVTFHDGTSEIVGSGWMTASQAITTINGLTAGGTTNYDAALLSAQTAFNTTGAIAGAQNVSYFLSDGVPNVATKWPSNLVTNDATDNGINSAEQTAWETFLHTHNITSFSLGLGSGTTVSALDPIAYDGVHGTQMPTDASGHDGIVINNLSQLSSVLLGTVIVPDNIAGNLISGSVPVSFGADGPAALKIVSIAHDTNGNGVIDSNEVYNTSSAGYNAATTTLTITTHEGGTLSVNFSTGDYTYTSPTTPALGTNEVFKYTVVDHDGDTATATLTVNLPVHDMLVAGTNINDQTGQTIDHHIDHDAPFHGPITGGGGNDILVGDMGGYAKGVGATANIVFVLDHSSSMGQQTISFNGAQETRLVALKDSMTTALNDLYNSDAQNVKVHLVSFNDKATDLGTFDLTVNGVDNHTALANAIAAVNGLTASGNTNYEAALQTANTWITSSSSDKPIASADVNEVIFVSDGAPNTPNSNASQYTDDAANILSHGFKIDAVGISVGDTGTTAHNYLDQVEGAASGSGAATNITTGEQLATVIGHLAGGNVVLSAAGNDNIVGGDGNDIIFGDALNTDALAHAHGLTTSAGAGWAVFEQLGWTEQQIVDYIKANHLSLSAESGRAGGNDTIDGGAGNDIIYGGAGNDIISGGTGNNILTGGLGADTFVISKGGHDTIMDYSKADGDKVDISSVLDTSAGDHLDVIKNADGSVKLEILNSSNVEKASVTFENIHYSDLGDMGVGHELDSLLGKVDVHHS